MTYNILNKKVYLGFSSKATVGDQIYTENTSFVVTEKTDKHLVLTKRTLSSNINDLIIHKPINNDLKHIAEYNFLLAERNTETENNLINTSTFYEGVIDYGDGNISFYCIDLKRDKITSVKRGLFYCDNPHLVISKGKESQGFILPFSDTKQWVEIFNEDTSYVGDVVRAIKRDIFPVFDKGRWSRSSDNGIVSIDWDNHSFCVSTGGNLHNLRPFDEIPCTCEDSQHRGFIYCCKHLISLQRTSYKVFQKSLIEALADKL